MTYIVWEDTHTLYGIPQGGYYVSYKDKLSDNYSDKWFEAKRYKTLQGAMRRIGYLINDYKTIDSFIKSYSSSISLKRNIKLSKVLGETITIEDIVNSRGSKIYIIDDNNNLIGDANKEVAKLIEDKIKKNNKKYTYIDSSYIDSEEDMDFWENWANS